jgi:hypothetical protein
MSVDTNTTIAEKDNNVIESVQDGKHELLRDVSSSVANSMRYGARLRGSKTLKK